MNSFETERLQVGDKVFYSYGGDNEHVVTVQKRTRTQVVLSNGARVNQRGNVIGGGTWSRSYVSPWTPEREAEIIKQQRRLRNINRLRNTAWSQLPDETLAALVVLLPKVANVS